MVEELSRYQGWTTSVCGFSPAPRCPQGRPKPPTLEPVKFAVAATDRRHHGLSLGLLHGVFLTLFLNEGGDLAQVEFVSRIRTRVSSLSSPPRRTRVVGLDKKWGIRAIHDPDLFQRHRRDGVG